MCLSFLTGLFMVTTRISKSVAKVDLALGELDHQLCHAWGLDRPSPKSLPLVHCLGTMEHSGLVQGLDLRE